MGTKRAALAILALLCATAAVTLAQGDDAPDYDDEYADPAGEEGDYGEPGGGDEDGELSPMPAGPEIVVDLTGADADTFDTEYLKAHPMVMLELYAPWCGHCKSFAPHYETAARALVDTFPNVTLAKVDATVNEAMGTKFNVEGYPTIKWIEYVEGGSPKVSDFRASPDADVIVDFVKKHAGLAVTVLPVDAAEVLVALATARASGPAVVVAFIPDVESAAFNLYLQAARQVMGVQWMYTADPGVLAVAAAAAALGEGAASAAFSAVTGAGAGAGPVIAVLRGESAAAPTAVLFAGALDNDTQVLFFGTPEQQTAAAAFYAEVATQYRGEYLFVSVTVDGSENAMGVAEYFGLVPESSQEEEEEEEDVEGEAVAKASKVPADFKPAVFIFYAPDEVDPEEATEEEEESDAEAAEAAAPKEKETARKWRLEGEFTGAALGTFLEAHKAGTLTPHFKSEAPPTPEEQTGPVTVVVGSTFDTIVMDPTKDVLLEVYAPWCQHCKMLEPIYEKLARRFIAVDSVVIAKMDGTKNEHPQLADVAGFPAIFLFPAGKDKTKVPHDDSEERTLLGFTRWLKANAKVPYKLKKKTAAKKEELGASPDAKEEL